MAQKIGRENFAIFLFSIAQHYGCINEKSVMHISNGATGK